MNLAEVARDWYANNEPEGALASAILRCFFRGTLICRPDLLLMGETCRTDGRELIPGEPHNCWFLHFWATEKGAMSSYELCLEAPYPLKWVAYKRRSKIKIVLWDRLFWKDFNVLRKPKGPYVLVS